MVGNDEEWRKRRKRLPRYDDWTRTSQIPHSVRGHPKPSSLGESSSPCHRNLVFSLPLHSTACCLPCSSSHWPTPADPDPAWPDPWCRCWRTERTPFRSGSVKGLQNSNDIRCNAIIATKKRIDGFQFEPALCDQTWDFSFLFFFFCDSKQKICKWRESGMQVQARIGELHQKCHRICRFFLVLRIDTIWHDIFCLEGTSICCRHEEAVKCTANLCTAQ